MPGWMQAFAEHQPVTVMVDAVRVLTQGPAARPCSATGFLYLAGAGLVGGDPGRVPPSWPSPATGGADRPAPPSVAFRLVGAGLAARPASSTGLTWPADAGAVEPAGQAGPGAPGQPLGRVRLVGPRPARSVLGPLERAGQLDQRVGVGVEVVLEVGVGGRRLRPPAADAGVAGPAGQLGVRLGHGVARPPPGRRLARTLRDHLTPGTSSTSGQRPGRPGRPAAPASHGRRRRCQWSEFSCSAGFGGPVLGVTVASGPVVSG